MVAEISDKERQMAVSDREHKMEVLEINLG